MDQSEKNIELLSQTLGAIKGGVEPKWADIQGLLAGLGTEACEWVGESLIGMFRDAGDRVLAGLNDPSCELADELDHIEVLLNMAHGMLNQHQEEQVSGFEDDGGFADGEDMDLLEMFVSGCMESLADLEEILLEAEDGQPDADQVADVRRKVHTFKGECGVLSLETAQKLCHEAETLIDDTQAQGIEFPSEALLALVDWMRCYLTALSSSATASPPDYRDLQGLLTGAASSIEGAEAVAQPAQPAVVSPPVQVAAPVVSEPEVCEATPAPAPEGRVVFEEDAMADETLPEFLEEAGQHLSEIDASLLGLEDHPEDEELLNNVFRAFHTIKGVAGFLNLDPIVRLAHSTESMMDAFRSQALKCQVWHVDLIFQAKDLMVILLNGLQGGETPLNSDLATLVQKVEWATEGKVLEGAVQAGPVQAVSTQKTETPATAKVAKKQGAMSVKVGTKRLDSMVDMVGELVIAQQMVTQHPSLLDIKDEQLERNLAQVSKITRDLQDAAMSLRMVTLKSTFQRMARLVRDVAKKSGKQVHLVVNGEDTELDRNVVDAIGDPLVHLIRNAIDHGMETPEERAKTNKPEKTTLELNAYHQGGSIVIEVKDDGRGMNKDRILAKAIENGLVPEGRSAEDFPDEEVFRMIFQPGFSTAEKVTDISGRGVGMDVVRRSIEAMRGKVEVSSEFGSGSSLRMRLPLTLAIIDGMVVRVADRRYVVPTLAIEENFRMDNETLHTMLGKGQMVDVRGSLVRVQTLRNLFGLEGEDDVAERGIMILLEAHGARACVVVDEILGQQQIVIKSLGKGLPSMPGVSGGAILGDGQVAPILDVEGVLAMTAGGKS
ncbi:MAG: chemotaxis protein CheA [Planctomycetes bacterium]|nr:chemotaxis protein CheA [Planctomycetota bacterium]